MGLHFFLTYANCCMKKIALLCLFAALMVGCHRQNLPEGIMSESQMVAFLTDAYLLESHYGISSEYNYDSIPDEAMAQYDVLLAKHELTGEQVDASIEYYSMQPELYAAIMDSVQRALNGMEGGDAGLESQREPMAIKLVGRK